MYIKVNRRIFSNAKARITPPFLAHVSIELADMTTEDVQHSLGEDLVVDFALDE